MKRVPDALHGYDFFSRFGVDKGVFPAPRMPLFEGSLRPENKRGRANGGGQVRGSALGREQKGGLFQQRGKIERARRVHGGDPFGAHAQG